MSFPLAGDLAAEEIPVRLTCGVLGHPGQAYYAGLAHPISTRELDDAYLTNALSTRTLRPGVRLPVAGRRARARRSRRG